MSLLIQLQHAINEKQTSLRAWDMTYERTMTIADALIAATFSKNRL
jgi:hypothetical protein